MNPVAPIEEAWSRIEALGPCSSAARIEVPLATLDPLRWLAAQVEPVKGYWRSRDGSLEIAAAGEADLVKGEGAQDYQGVFDHIHAKLRGGGTEMRYFGGFRFATTPPSEAWRPFGSHRFILPQAEVIRCADRCTLGVNLLPATDRSQLRRWLDSLVMLAQPALPEMPAVIGRRDDPTRDLWMERVDACLDQIRAGSLRKIVLARRTILDFADLLHPLAMVVRLRDAQPDCFHFCGSHAGIIAFMGASPERLYCREGRRLQTEALAGTRQRASQAHDDQALADGLLHSGKDLEEHRIVASSIVESLAPLADRVEADPAPSLFKLSQVQHLRTEIRARLRDDTRDGDLLARLHPTPAVGGFPRAQALAEITRLEGFDRGWYAAPVGWIGQDGGEFAVAIRCGLMGGHRLCLYAGAGIVEGSRPDDEWREVENKLAAFTSVLSP